MTPLSPQLLFNSTQSNKIIRCSNGNLLILLVRQPEGWEHGTSIKPFCGNYVFYVQGQAACLALS